MITIWLKKRGVVLLMSAMIFIICAVYILEYYRNTGKLQVERLERKEAFSENQMEEDKKTAERFAKRLKVMKSQCPGWEASPYKKSWVPNKNFLLNYPRRILICAVPKAGSTAWHMTVWAMRKMQAGEIPDTKYYNNQDTVFNHAMSGRLSKEEGENLIRYNEGDDDVMKNQSSAKSHRLILARHPFARLISGWHQKFLPGMPYAKHMFDTYPALRKYRKHVDPDHEIAFEDLATYVAEYGKLPGTLDYHFVPGWILCKPCQYAYTYIVKAEAVDQDESWLRRRLNMTDIDIGRKGVPPGGSLVNESPSENIKKYMSKLTPDVRRLLYEIYEADFKTFGYTFDFDTLESGGFE